VRILKLSWDGGKNIRFWGEGGFYNLLKEKVPACSSTMGKGEKGRDNTIYFGNGGGGTPPPVGKMKKEGVFEGGKKASLLDIREGKKGEIYQPSGGGVIFYLVQL